MTATRRTLPIPALAATIAVAIAIGGPAAAQDVPANLKAEWDKLVAAANAEGELVMNSQPNKNARDYILTEWGKAYPKIALSLSVVPTGQLLARLRTERGAGKYLWDLSVSGSSTAYILSKDGMIDSLHEQFVLPDIKNPETWGGWDHVFFDKARKYVVALSQALKSPYYNMARLSQDKVDKLKLKTLLEPEYKGKIVWHDPARPGSGNSFAYILRSRLGDDGLRKLIVDQRVHFVPQQEQVVEALARETHWIGIGPFASALMRPFHAAGIKVQVRSFGNDPEVNEMSMGGAGLYVFANRPHPNATKVFVNWILSKGVQAGLSKVMLQDSRRQDLPSVSEPERVPRKGVKYLETQREEYLKDVEAAAKWVTETRKEVK